MLETRDILNVEILSVGTWNGTGCPPGGCKFDDGDLDAFAASYNPNHLAPIKLGHDEKQRLLQTDGYPAAGWLTNLRTEIVGGTKKLFADLSRVPKTIADLMQAGAYSNRSVEMHGNRITALALLGADLPAVENLSDIMSWYSAQFEAPPADRVIMFTATTAASAKPPADPPPPSFTDDGEAALTALAAFTARAQSRAEFRKGEGRTLSQDNRDLLTKLAASAGALSADLERLLSEGTEKPPDPPQPDYGPVMHARARLAAYRMAELTGATT